MRDISNMKAKDLRNELGLIAKTLLIIRDWETKKFEGVKVKNYIKTKDLGNFIYEKSRKITIAAGESEISNMEAKDLKNELG